MAEYCEYYMDAVRAQLFRILHTYLLYKPHAKGRGECAVGSHAAILF